MKKVIVLNKKEGETPLEALEVYRKKHLKYLEVPMTYAGRLDPMASGALIILAGEEIKDKEKYISLDKEYEFEVLFGFSTDTQDILGKVFSKFDFLEKLNKKDFEKEIKINIKSFLGEITQEYPMYSSKTVKGKPLFTYARRGEKVDIPKRKVYIKKIKLNKVRKISSKKLLQNIEKRIKKVKGDFRQDEIQKIWRKNLFQDVVSRRDIGFFYIASFKINCSSGTYVRVIADSLGKSLGIPALAFSIRRTKVGKYVI